MIVDSDNYAAAGIETLFFPGGEPHAKIPNIQEDVLLFLKLRSWDAVGIAACVIDAFERHHGWSLATFIPYFPGARQDKTDGHNSLTVELMWRLLARGSTPVFTFDPHSTKLFDYARIEVPPLMPADLKIPIRPDVAGIIAPDKGATDRAYEFRDRFYHDAAVIQCSKRRDSATGRLSGYALPPLKREGRYVIVDDICDGGGTFNLLADAFGTDPAAKGSRLEMFVSHGIFSKGLNAISPLIEHITTTDSWCQLNSDDRLTVLPLAPLFKKIGGYR